MPAFASTCIITDVSPISGTSPLPVTITFTLDQEGDGSAVSVYWDFGDGNTQTVLYSPPRPNEGPPDNDPNPLTLTINHTYTAPGSYTVQCNATWQNSVEFLDYWSVRYQGQTAYPPSSPNYATETAPYIVPVVVLSGPITYGGGSFQGVNMKGVKIGGTTI